MDKIKKILPVALMAVIALLGSCTTCPSPEGEISSAAGTTTTVPAITIITPATTTTTTVAPATTTTIAPVTTTTAAPVTTTTVAPVTTTTVAALPKTSEAELGVLYDMADRLRTDANELGTSSVLPEKHAAAEATFQDAKADYDRTMAGTPYLPEAGALVKPKLESSISAWNGVIDEGLPLLSEKAGEDATDARFRAIAADAPTLAADRFATGEALKAKGDAFDDSAEYRAAIPAYEQATLAYDISAEKATANAAREKIYVNGYAQYAPAFYDMAEADMAAEEQYWAAGTPTDMEAGLAKLKDANLNYAEVIAKGAEFKAYEGKDKALEAKAQADSVNAELNAPEEYSSANDVMGEAEKNWGEANYESAYLWYNDAADAYYRAYDESVGMQGEAEDALKTAEIQLETSSATAAEAGLAGNDYLKAAEGSYANAETKLADNRFADSIVDSNETLNYCAMSDDYVKAQLAERDAAAEKARLASIADSKAAADAAMADARARMAWADEEGIAKDYPAVYNEASAAMSGAEMAYANERYEPAKGLANEVSSTLSDDFMAKVAADRAAAKAAAKADADPVMAEARARMAWADANGIAKAYPNEYKEAAAALQGAELAYANERYAAAKNLAAETIAILAPLKAPTPVATVDADAAAKIAAAEAKAKAKDLADADLSAAIRERDLAVGRNALNNYPDLMAKGDAELAAARAALSAGDYAAASARAKAAKDIFAGIGAYAALPATYKVRLIPERRDCLWRIAEYGFVYNNPLKWPVLYEANKKTFRDPSNPNLIYPGQILKIPSIKGETREGAWDSKKTYQPLAK